MNNKKLIEGIKNIGLTKIFLILGAGIVFLSLEFGAGDNKENDNNNSAGYTEELEDNELYSPAISLDFIDNEFVSSMEKKIKEMVMCVGGVKTANVFVTIKTGSKRVVLTETPYNRSDTTENDKNGGNRVITNEDKNYNTVYVTDSNGNEIPYVVSVNAPEILGIAVTVSGNISATDKDNIIRTINTLTGIGINNISVIITN